MKHLWILFLFNLSLLFAEQQTHLSFAPNSTKTFVLTASLDVQQELLGKVYAWKGTQRLLFDATLFGEQSDLPIVKPPFSMKILCKTFEGTFKYGSKEKKFGIDQLKGHPLLAQICEGIKKPLEFSYDSDHFTFKGGESSKLPLAHNYPPEEILNHLFDPIFGLLSHSFSEGEIVTKVFSQNASFQNTPFKIASVDYKIQKISPEEIQATFRGTLPEQTFDLTPRDFEGRLTFTGALEGIISWNRKNALETSYTAHFFSSGTLQMKDFGTFPTKIEAHIELAPK